MDSLKPVAGRTLTEWQEFARRDDCLDRMVPSDLRQIIASTASQLAAVDVELETLAYMREIATEMSYPSILEALEALSEYREEAAAVDALVEALRTLLAEARERGGGVSNGERLGCSALAQMEASRGK